MSEGLLLVHQGHLSRDQCPWGRAVRSRLFRSVTKAVGAGRHVGAWEVRSALQKDSEVLGSSPSFAPGRPGPVTLSWLLHLRDEFQLPSL